MAPPGPGDPRSKVPLILVATAGTLACGVLVLAVALAVVIRTNAVVSGDDEETPRVPQVGLVAPDFELQTLGGRSVSSQSFRGSPTVLNFFGTFHPIAGLEATALAELAERTDGRVHFVGVNWGEDRAVLAAWLGAREDPGYPILVDEGKRVAAWYGVTGIPETFVIDAQGAIRFEHIGPVHPGDLVAELESLLSAHLPPLQARSDPTSSREIPSELRARSTEALDIARARVIAAPDEVARRVELGYALIDAGGYVEAWETSQQILGHTPDHPDGLVLQGLVRVAMDMHDQAEDLFDRALQQDPDHVIALTYKGMLIERAEREGGDP